MRQARRCGLLALLLTLAASGCESNPHCGEALTRCGPAGGHSSPTSFESDLGAGSDGISKSGPSRDADNGEAAPTAPGGQATSGKPDSTSGNDAGRAIVEADIIQVQGDRLYALSRIAGLSVIDVSDTRALKLLGRFRELPATPFEMYLKDGVALVMFTGWGEYVRASDDSVSYVSTSKLLALDVRDPAQIEQLGSFDLPGTISDSRMVGDILYVVGYENGYCWGCSQEPRTSIVSLGVGDPRKIEKIDELFYEDGNQSYGGRSVTVTAERMYVAGPEWGQDMPTGSTIQVVDISDAAGDLAQGTSVKVEGQVNSRWQMDEYNGVLRVVSQPPQWWSENGRLTMKPAIETFKVESSQKLTALGRADIEIPQDDTLRSVRFDGERGYAITALQKDPLYTLDLRDPAKPRVVGELKIPGFVYHMEPRGDRVLGLGFDQGNAKGGITVSLFNVSDIANPTEIARVNFGGTWGSLPEDQDRIHKVFRVLAEQGLILVPFSGWSDQQSDGCYGRPVGGVQVIDFANDTLTARGATPSEGEARRALLVDDALLSVSDERVQSFDISDRDKPKLVSQVVLSRPVFRAVQLDNGAVVRLSMGNSKGQWIADIVASKDVEDPNKSLAEVNLSELAANAKNRCEGSISWDDTFVHGTQLEVLYTGYAYDPSNGTQSYRQGYLVLDVSDPSKPKLAANVSWDGDDAWSRYGSFYSYGYYGSNKPAIRTDNALVMLESKWENDSVSSKQSVRLRVLDLRDLANVKNTLLPFEAVSQYSGLHADGDVVMTGHLEPSASDSRRGRFYLDRFDLSDPTAPKQLAKVNVPGVLVAFDTASQRAITSEQVRLEVGEKTAEECYEQFASAEWTGADQNGGADVGTPETAGDSKDAPVDAPPPARGQCVGYKQRLSLVHVVGDLATLDDRIELREDQQMFSLSQGDGIVFASVGRARYYYVSGPTADVACFGPCGGGGESAQPTELLVLGGFDTGMFEEGHLTVEDKGADAWYGFWGSPPVYAYGKRALLAGRSDAAIIDASTASEPKLVKRLPLVGSVQYAEVHEENALLTFGQQGVQWLDLRD